MDVPLFLPTGMELTLSRDFIVLFWQVLFVIACVVQVFYFAFVHFRVAWYKPATKRRGGKKEPVSVVIAARNEAENLLQNLPLVLEQDYPEYEVIVVNDGSLDETPEVLQAFKQQHKHLKVVNVPENERYNGGKKYAVTLGIKAAEHQRILLTDADCRPAGKHWIKAMAGSATGKGQIILGYSPYQRQKGWLNAIIRYDSMMTAMNYLGCALAGVPYMGVGRNLSYPREVFFEVGGFRSHYSLQSGDDDLFVNQVANAENTAVCMDRDALMESVPEVDFKAFWMQKRRHFTTGWKYKRIHRLLLALQPISLVCFFAAAISLLFGQVWTIGVLVAILIRILVQIIIFKRSAELLGQKDLVLLAPLLEVVLVVISTAVHIANASSKQSKWKT